MHMAVYDLVAELSIFATVLAVALGAVACLFLLYIAARLVTIAVLLSKANFNDYKRKGPK